MMNSKLIQLIENREYEVISSSERCIKCKFQCRIILNDIMQIKISCKHPKGPGNPQHCIYFKKKDN